MNGWGAGQSTHLRHALRSVAETDTPNLHVKTSTKAVLLSALVYPGSGQLLLKRYLAAALLMGAATVALVMLVIPAVTATQQILGRLKSGELVLGPDFIRDVQLAVEQAVGPSTSPGLALLVIWLVSIAHAWIIGRWPPK